MLISDQQIKERGGWQLTEFTASSVKRFPGATAPRLVQIGCWGGG